MTRFNFFLAAFSRLFFESDGLVPIFLTSSLNLAKEAGVTLDRLPIRDEADTMGTPFECAAPATYILVSSVLLADNQYVSSLC